MNATRRSLCTRVLAPVAANNQWDVEKELLSDLGQTSFRKALELCEGAVSILDSRGVVFSRAWCAKPHTHSGLLGARVCLFGG